MARPAPLATADLPAVAQKPTWQQTELNSDISAAIPGTLNAAQQQLSATMQRYWTSFAQVRLPISAAGPRWPAFTTAGQQLISLTTPRSVTITTFGAAHNCAFWASLAPA